MAKECEPFGHAAVSFQRPAQDAGSSCSTLHRRRFRRHGSTREAVAYPALERRSRLHQAIALPTLPHRAGIQHVALAARIDVAVVLDVHRSAPQVVAWMLPILCTVARIGAHQVRFICFDANLVDTRRVSPEPDEIIHFVRSSAPCGPSEQLPVLCSALLPSCARSARKLSRTFSNRAPLR